MQITQFKIAATTMLSTLKKFKEHLEVCENEFEETIANENQLSSMLYQYEQQVTEQFGDGSKTNQPADLMASAKAHAKANDMAGSNDIDQSSMVFDQLQVEIADNEKLNDWQMLNDKMQLTTQTFSQYGAYVM